MFDIFGGKETEQKPLVYTFLNSLKVEKECEISKIRSIPISKDRLIVHIEDDEIWQISIQRKLDSYYKNVEYSLIKHILWKRGKLDTRKFLEVHNDKGTDYE
mmetsp:Transcript_32626/g.28886  ORF Transcript_32626/g.28886 Transcript_32626/m.28886 type:complete len:102 (+) Transcript_32626:784-1089(+)